MGAGHGHHHGNDTRAFAWVTLINLAYTVVEAGYGFATDSLALLTDALHNFGDVLGLALAWGAASLAKRAPTTRHTYGWRRATLLAPLGNALVLVLFSGVLGVEAVRRLFAPPEVPGLPVLVVAAGPQKEKSAAPKRNDRPRSRAGSRISHNRKEITHVPVANAGFQRIHHAGDSRDAGSVSRRFQRRQPRCNRAVSGRLHW